MKTPVYDFTSKREVKPELALVSDGKLDIQILDYYIYNNVDIHILEGSALKNFSKN